MSNYRSQNLTDFANAFKALSNPNRLAIFLHLVSCCPPGTACRFDEEIKKRVGDLGTGLGIAQSTISHHIKELLRAGLIEVEKRGKYTECRVDPDAVRLLANLVTGRISIQGMNPESRLKAAGEELCATLPAV